MTVGFRYIVYNFKILIRNFFFFVKFDFANKSCHYKADPAKNLAVSTYWIIASTV